jgi:two-component system response regulator AtoC
MKNILVVDDDPQIRFFIDQALKREDYGVVMVEDAETAWTRAQEESFSLVLTDVCLPGLDGLQLLDRLLERDPQSVVIVMTAFTAEGAATEAMKRGAYDFFPKPFKVREMRQVIRRGMDKVALQERVRELENQLQEVYAVDQSLDQALAGYERQLLIESLKIHGGVQARAAEALGVSQRSMWHRVKKHNIPVSLLKSACDDS